MKKKIKLDDSQIITIINAVNDFRNKLIREEMYIEDVNEILLLLINTLEK